MNDPTICPECGSDNTRCYDENSGPRYLPDTGEYDGEYIVASFICHACRHDWIVLEPDDDDICEANEIIDEDADARD